MNRYLSGFLSLEILGKPWSCDILTSVKRESFFSMGYVAEVVDLFSGIGGLSHGFKKAGFKIVGGFDVDKTCKFAFESNNQSSLNIADIAELRGEDINRCFSGSTPTVLAGCAPCQPFSTYKRRYCDDPRWNLVGRFADIAVEANTDFVTMENVPQLLKHKNGAVFEYLCEKLKTAGYSIWFNVENAIEYGVAQNRERLVFLARKGSNIVFPNKKSDRLTVREVISKLPSIEAGECDINDPMHRSSKLSAKNLIRIQNSTPGGSWRDWPKDLIADCHKKDTGKSYGSVYGRMSWDKPAPTMTTQCFGFGNGRFGHPEQNRAISLREAAIIQSFPKTYRFAESVTDITMKKGGRWIGNAVPVNLAEGIASGIREAING